MKKLKFHSDFKKVVEIKCIKELDECFTLDKKYVAYSLHSDQLNIIDDDNNMHTISTSKNQDWNSDEFFSNHFIIVKYF